MKFNIVSTEELLEKFFANYPEIQYSKGDKILRPNEYYNHIYMVTSGYIRVYKVLRNGQEVTISFYNPKKQKNILFGYTSLLTEFYVEALTDIKLRRAPKTDFQQCTDENPRLNEHVISDLSIYLEEIINQVEWLSVTDAYTRLKLLFHSLGIRIGSNCNNKIMFDNKSEHGLKITYNLIASLTGLSRETVTMQTNRLITEGYLSRQDNGIVIEKFEDLVLDL